MPMFKVSVLIDAPDDDAAELARSEIANGCQDAEDAGEVPRGTFLVEEVEVAS